MRPGRRRSFSTPRSAAVPAAFGFDGARPPRPLTDLTERGRPGRFATTPKKNAAETAALPCAAGTATFSDSLAPPRRGEGY